MTDKRKHNASSELPWLAAARYKSERTTHYTSFYYLALWRRMATALCITSLPGNKAAKDKDRFMNYIYKKKKNSCQPDNHRSIERQEHN
jgi:hypothetical protein